MSPPRKAEQPPTFGWKQAGALLLWLALLAAAVGLFAGHGAAVALGVSYWWGVAWVAAAVLVGPPVVFVAVIVVLVLWLNLRLRSEAYEFGLVRKVAPTPGAVVRFAEVTAWVAEPDDHPPRREPQAGAPASAGLTLRRAPESRLSREDHSAAQPFLFSLLSRRAQGRGLSGMGAGLLVRGVTTSGGRGFCDAGVPGRRFGLVVAPRGALFTAGVAGTRFSVGACRFVVFGTGVPTVRLLGAELAVPCDCVKSTTRHAPGRTLTFRTSSRVRPLSVQRALTW
jgi:hypothetical protein